MVKKVVLTDDDRDDASLFREALLEVNNRIDFEYFEGGKEAIQHLNAKEHEIPDVIFLDINMPVISGWHCLEEFKRSQQLKNVPIYIYTTSSHKKEKERAMQMGATGFITKPSDFKELIEILRKTILIS